jgi:hypothetical protein
MLLTFLVLVAIGVAAFVERHEIQRLLAPPLEHLRTASAMAEGAEAQRITRWRFPAGAGGHLKTGMTGSLCARDNCFASWRVVAVEDSSIVVEISANGVRARKPKS